MKCLKKLLVLSVFLSLSALVGCDEGLLSDVSLPFVSETNSENTSPSDTSSPSVNASVPDSSVIDSSSTDISSSDDTTLPEGILTVSEALEIAQRLSNGQTTTEEYLLTGTVTDFYNATYGNYHLVDDAGADITIYGTYNFDGSIRYDAMSDKPDDGDVVILQGPLMNYYKADKGTNTYEMVDAKLLFLNGVDLRNNNNNNGGNTSNPEINDNDIKYDENGWTYTGNYYGSFNADLSGNDLLNQLRSINTDKKTKNIGYKNMWNYFNKTDYDPNNSGKYLAFYRGTSASKGEMNKEHVWPNSRGGNLIEGDIHVIRPTLTSDNSSRGNSFYVEGKASSNSGWDPKADGMNEDYRGQAARIIFYGVVANNQLKLVDTTNDSTGNKSMGKLSDLLRWNLQYPVQASEIRRNDGAQEVQGNRNPFIDNPSFACSIWGNTNADTKAICSAANVKRVQEKQARKKLYQRGYSNTVFKTEFIKIDIALPIKKENEII